MPSLVLRLCGDVALSSADAVPIEPLGAKTLGLLAYLAMEPGAHRRELPLDARAHRVPFKTQQDSDIRGVLASYSSRSIRVKSGVRLEYTVNSCPART